MDGLHVCFTWRCNLHWPGLGWDRMGYSKQRILQKNFHLDWLLKAILAMVTPGSGCEGRAKISFKNKGPLFLNPTLLCITGKSRRPVPFADEVDTLFNQLCPIFLGWREPLLFFVPSCSWIKKAFTICSAEGRREATGPWTACVQEVWHSFKECKVDFHFFLILLS
jgi:hypothetical protein